ncbi:hypothetical protein DV738_g455, partial [Chaetothyriales sp. CBS 135597]
MAAGDKAQRIDISVINPVLRAYAVTYVAAVGQRALGSQRQLRRLDLPVRDKFQLIATILKSGIKVNRFPTAAALIVAGATSSGGRRPKYAGKTLGLTLFAICRALDVLAISAWNKTSSWKWHPEQRAPHFAQLVKSMADTWIFAASDTFIMHAWFYSPDRLPKAYNKWISSASELDPRLMQVLRLCRQGDFVYGQDTGCASVLQGLCDELGLPREWADPAKTIPIPCELYHCGAGTSCEVHALSRWLRGFIFALKLYLPIQLLARVRHMNQKKLAAAFKGSARYSAFLATFISLFYYSVCLSRTRLGPRLFSSKTVTPQMWDAGLGVLAGCLACGWSILIVPPQQRHELAFFVAPRALATLMPQVYDQKHQRREQFVFATSAAIVLAAANEGGVRGVFGRMLNTVMRE